MQPDITVIGTRFLLSYVSFHTTIGYKFCTSIYICYTNLSNMCKTLHIIKTNTRYFLHLNSHAECVSTKEQGLGEMPMIYMVIDLYAVWQSVSIIWGTFKQYEDNEAVYHAYLLKVIIYRLICAQTLILSICEVLFHLIKKVFVTRF